ncbi:hypothetical protein [Bosea vaviloviae]|uniref:Uncharacterized protein n=1 Tax=Bosea vaviloviae TaxID=1526658 RepID=A0A1D7U6W4_9HYPH|nr:hypothetical protein [Bosea vaviloviae]AOO83113.1 hypothetical protein BHK69_24105 [Bosea vaviloviae]
MAGRLARVALISSAILVLPWAGCSLASRSYQRNLLPEKLQTGWFYAEGSCNSFLGYVGAFAFSLSDKTVDALKNEGLAFFHGDDDPAKMITPTYFHGEWKETPPVQPSFFADGPGAFIHCGQAHSWLWPKGIIDALRKPGSFYKQQGGRGIYVIPELSLVVGVGYDR